MILCSMHVVWVSNFKLNQKGERIETYLEDQVGVRVDVAAWFEFLFREKRGLIQVESSFEFRLL